MRDIISFSLIILLIFCWFFLLHKKIKFKNSTLLYFGLITLIILIFLTPFLIDGLFLRFSQNHTFHTKFKASDILGYLGIVLSFFSTISLGALAFWQNKQIKSDNDKNNRNYLSFEQSKIRRPYYIIDSENDIFFEDIDGKKVTSKYIGNSYELNVVKKDIKFFIKLKNIGEGPALYTINPFDGIGRNPERKIFDIHEMGILNFLVIQTLKMKLERIFGMKIFWVFIILRIYHIK